MPLETPPDYDRVWTEVYGDLQEHGPVHRHMRRLLRRMIGGLDYSSVLDVGCGAGDNLELLTQGRSLDAVVGVDISEVALERARARWPQAEFHHLDVEREALDGTWELVFSSLLLEHLPDDGAALEHLRRMCSRHLVLTTIGGDLDRYRPWDEQMGHVRNYVRGELEEKLAGAGFRVERFIRWGFPFYSPMARLLQNRMSSEPSYSRATRVLADAMHAVYYLNSSRRGDLLVVHAAPV
jgi:SAM-dependent methyltransferase